MAEARLADASTAQKGNDAAGESNGGDPVGDSQADYSGWGGIDECAAVAGRRITAMVSLDGPYRRQTAWRRLLKFLGRGH